MQQNRKFLYSMHLDISQLPHIINNMELEIVSKFKYLGIIFSDNGTFNTAVLTLAGQAKKVLFTIYGELGRFPLNVKRHTRVIKFWSKLAKIGHLFYTI